MNSVRRRIATPDAAPRTFVTQCHASVRTLAQQERRFALALFLPALLLLILTTTTPLVYLAWTSVQRVDLFDAVAFGFRRASTTTPRWRATRVSGVR